jgi:nucleotide-binding universal stress UspA family protein
MSDRPLPKTVLVGYEPSGASDDALRAGLELGRLLGASTRVLHAIDFPQALLAGLAPETVVSARQELERSARANLEAAFEERGANLGLDREPASLNVEIRSDHPARALRKAVDEFGTDLVVLGRHVRRGLLDLGSATRSLLADGSPLVWMQVGAWSPPKRLLVPVDLSELSLEALAVARDFAGRFGASLTVLHSFVRPDLLADAPSAQPISFPTYVVEDVRAKQAEELASLEDSFDWRGVPHELVFTEGPPVDELVRRQVDADAVVLGTHGRTGLARFLMGNVALAFLSKSSVPVLAVRPL